VAASRLTALRTLAALVAVAVLAWVAYETVHAGSDVPAPATQGLTQLSGGRASDKRVDGKSWSLDYDSATMSADGSTADIEHIRDGVIMRNGKPYMHVRAQHITANLALNDFVVTGPVTFDEVGGLGRTLVTNGAHYLGFSHTLELPNRTTIRSGPVRLVVDHATVNFATGETTLGRIVGTM
jgi:hypothetical protein